LVSADSLRAPALGNFHLKSVRNQKNVSVTDLGHDCVEEAGTGSIPVMTVAENQVAIDVCIYRGDRTVPQPLARSPWIYDVPYGYVRHNCCIRTRRPGMDLHHEFLRDQVHMAKNRSELRSICEVVGRGGRKHTLHFWAARESVAMIIFSRYDHSQHRSMVCLPSHFAPVFGDVGENRESIAS